MLALLVVTTTAVCEVSVGIKVFKFILFCSAVRWCGLQFTLSGVIFDGDDDNV